MVKNEEQSLSDSVFVKIDDQVIDDGKPCTTPNKIVSSIDMSSIPPMENHQTSSIRSTHLDASFVSVFENEFKFVRTLGRGGFGQVFEVENILDGCRYAIKRIQIDLLDDGDDDEQNKFLREVKGMSLFILHG